MARRSNPSKDKQVTRRAPRQARAQEKVELILEAAIRLLERDGIDSLTTNSLAETAGVSIGTLYQYFPDKEAVLSALADREVAGMSARVLARMHAPLTTTPDERIRAVIHAVLDAYGRRRRAHRLLMLHSMNRGPSARLAPLFAQLNELLTGQGLAAPGRAAKTLSQADAFVLMHAITAVLRAMIAQNACTPSRDEIEAALTRLILRFVQSPG